MLVSISLGSVFARTQREFYVMAESDTDYVILAMYGDRLVLAPLAPQENTLLPHFEVRVLDQRPIIAERWSVPSLTVAPFIQADVQERTKLRAQRAAATALAAAPRR